MYFTHFIKKNETMFAIHSILIIPQQTHYNKMQQSNNNNNMMVYIARMGATHSERDIIRILQHANIGLVAYADLTAVKDNSPSAGSNPETVWYSAFVMMKEWNPVVLADMRQFGQVKVWIDSQSTAYWMLRFATEGSEIPRSRVNTHQLAHYTAELYDMSSTMTKKTEESNTRLSYCVKDLYDRTNAAEKRAKEQAMQIEEQNDRMAHMLEQMEKLLVKNCELTQTVAYMDAFLTGHFAERPENDEEWIKEDLKQRRIVRITKLTEEEEKLTEEEEDIV